MTKFIHQQFRRKKNHSKEEVLAKIFEITAYVFEKFVYGLIWLVKIIGTIVIGVFYGLAIGLIFVSKELYQLGKWTKPYIKTFLVKYFFPTIGKLLVILALGIKYTFIYLALGLKYFFVYSGKAIYFLLSKFWRWFEYDFAPWMDNVFIPWVKNKFAPFIKAKAPVVANAAAVSAKYFALVIFYLVKGTYLFVEFTFKTLWHSSSVLTDRLAEFFGPKAQYVYEHRQEIKANISLRLQEYKLFLFWLLKPITRLIPDKLEKGFLPQTNQLQLALQPAVTYSDFRQLIREPRHSLLRKAMASCLIFFLVFSAVGIASLTPLFDWLFQNRLPAYAAPFTGQVKISKQTTTLSTSGGWYTSLAHSGDGISGDAESGTFNPIHPGGTTDGTSGAGLAIGYLTAAATTYATAEFIGFRPNANGNLAGVMLVMENLTAASRSDVDIVVELLQFPSASCTTTSCVNYATGSLDNHTYPADTVVLRRTVWQFNQGLSGENLAPGNYGRATFDFRFDPPVAVTTSSHYGIRIINMGAGAPVFGVWAANAPFGNFPTINGTFRTIGVTDIDNTNAPTMNMPLALTGNSVIILGASPTQSSGMVAGNSAAGVGMPTVRRTENEHWTATYSSANGNWTIAGSVSGAQSRKLTTATTGGTGASWVNDGVPMTTLTVDSDASTRLCVASVSGFAPNQTINLWDSDTATLAYTIASVNISDSNCSDGPSIITTAATIAGYTINKNATVVQATWKQRIIQGAEQAFTQNMPTTSKICVADASQFSVRVGAAASVAIWDNNSAILGTNAITAIIIDDPACANPANDSLTLASTITAGTYTLDQNARVAEISATLSNTGTPSDGAIMRWTAFNYPQNPTASPDLARTSSVVLGLAKNLAPAASNANYPFLSNWHIFFIAYGDANTNAPADGDIVIVGNGKTDPDTDDSPNLTNDLNWSVKESHVVTVDRNWNAALAYTGNYGTAILDGAGARGNFAVYSQNGGWVSAVISPGSQLLFGNSPNTHYRITIPGKIVVDSDSSLAFGKSGAAIPASSFHNIYFDNVSPAASTLLTSNTDTGTILNVVSTSGFNVGDTIIIRDNNSAAITRLIGAIENLTQITVTAALVAGYTTDQAAFIAKGPTTELPTGADRRAGVYTMTGLIGASQANFRTGRVSLYAQGSDSFRTMKSDLAVDIEGDINTGFLGNNLTDSGNTWLDVKDNVVGNWQPLDQIAVAGATNQLADNEFSSIRMAGNDDANQMPVWTGLTGAGGRNALPTPNMEVAEIGTIPMTNIYNYNQTGGAFSQNYATATSWTIFGDGANTEVSDAVYFGDQGNNMFYSLEFNIGTAMVANASYVWEYWNGSAWTSFTPRDAYRYEPRTDYCMPLSANTVRNSFTLTVPDGGTNFGLDQIVAISDNDSPTIYRRLGTTAPTATTLTFSEPLPAGYTTAQNARVCRLSGGRWIAFDPSAVFTSGTGRRILSWTPFNLVGTPAKRTINGINAFWVRARISSFASWTTSPTNQTTPIGMSGIERVSSGHITMSSGVQEAKITEITPGASYDPNEQWTLEYGNSPGWLEIIRGAAVGVPSAPYIWRISDGVLNFNATNIQNWAVHNGDLSWTNYTMSALVRMDMVADATSRRLGIMMRQDLDGNGYAALITKTSTVNNIQWFTTALGVPTAIGSATTKTFNADTWYCLKAQVTGTTLNAKFWETTDCSSGEPVSWDITTTNSLYTNGRIGLYTGSATASQGMKAMFDSVSTDTGFSDTFTDTGTWRVVGSTQGLIGTATPSTPFTSGYLNFTIKHKGGWNGVVQPEIGDKIYLSSTAIRSYRGLDASVGITTSNINTKYEVWDFEWNGSSYTVTGSASGAGGTAAPGSTYTAPNNQIRLRINSGAPTGTRFGNRMLLLQDNLLRNNGSWIGTNGMGSAVLIYPSYTLTGSPIATRRNIETPSGTATWRGRGTIDFWFKTNYSGSPQDSRGTYLFDWAAAGATANSNRIFIRHTPDGFLEASIWGATMQGTILRQSFSAVAGQWYHFRLGWDATANTRRAWLNGAPFSTGFASTFTGARSENVGILRIGNRWTYDAPFDGSIDEFAVFDEDIDTSPNCDWGVTTPFTPPASVWTDGQTAGCTIGKEAGVNLFRASFDSAMNPQEGFVWADYAYGNPAMIFTNGADTGNERFRIITYPQRTRIWIDNTGEKYTPSARIKFGSGFLESAALATLAGWSHNFTFHHKAKRDSITNPTYSPVLNLKRSTHIWSEEPFTYTGATMGVPINAGLGFGLTAVGLSGLATMNINHLSMENQFSNFSIMTNPFTSVRPHPSQTISNSVFYNYYDRAYTVSAKTQGTNYVGAYFVTTHFGAANIGTGYNASASQNVGIDGSIFMGARNLHSVIPPVSANGAAAFFSGRLYTIRNSEFHNNGITGAGTTGALNFSSGVAKLTIENNIFSINTNGVRLYGNSFVVMDSNVFDGHISDNVTTVGSEYGAGVRSAQSFSSVYVSDNRSIFGRGLWNEADINLPPNTVTFEAESMLQFTGRDTILHSPVIFGTVDYVNMGRVPEAYFHTTIPGTDIRFGSGKNIANLTTFGNMRTTGSGLTDTTVRTRGGYAWRLDPRSSDVTLDYTAKVVGVAGKPLAATGYLRINEYYGSSGLPTVTFSGLGMTGPNLTWTAQSTANTWQQFVVSGTPTESALAEIKISVSMEGVEVADSGISQIIANPMGNYLPPLIEDADKSWTPNQWVGYLMKDRNGKIFEIVRNTNQLLYVKGTVAPHLLSTTFTAATPGDYIIFRQPMVYLDDVSVLSGAVDTGTLDFHTAGQPVSPWLATGLTAEAVWGVQYSIFADIAGSMGQLLNDRLAVKRGLVSDANASQTQFVTDLTETTSNFYQNQIIVLMSGRNAGISRRIVSYDGTGKKITVDAALPFAPAFNDSFVILSQYAVAGGGGGATAEEIWNYTTRRLTDATLTGGGFIATKANTDAIAADVTYIKNKVDSIYADTQYIRGKVDDILTKWGSYTAADIMAEVDDIEERIGLSTDPSTAGTLFGRTKYLQEKWGIQTAQVIYNKAEAARAKAQEIQTELGYNGRSTTAYQDLQILKGYTDRIESEVAIIKSRVGQATDSSTADTLFGRIRRNYETIQALNNLSAQQVWEYGVRTLTGGVILSDPAQIWNVATSLLTTFGSIGKLIVDNLDVAVSTRGTSDLTAADVWDAAERTITNIKDPGLAAIAANVWDHSTRELTAGDLTAKRVWDTLLSAITTTNSIGLLLKTNIDTQLSVVKTDLTAEINQNEAKLDTLISNLIVAQSLVNDTGATVTRFKTNLINTNNDFYNDGVLVFTSGLNSGQVRRIVDYDGTNKKITVNPALTVAPSNGDTFTILAQTANASLDAGTIWNYATRRLTDAQLDSGSLATLANLQTTEISLTDQITRTQKITVGKIINQDTSIKSGNILTILFRADSGLTGNDRPTINVWDPSGTQVVTNQYMTELGSTGVYRYALTFESAWGTGQFTVQSSEATNNTKDSINISVTATDIATIGATIDLLARDLISVRSTVSTVSASSTVSSFGTNLTSAVSGLYNNALITFVSGANAGVARRIENYSGTTKVLTIEPDLPSAPVDGDGFTILKQIAVPTTKITTIQTDVAAIRTDVALIRSRLDNVDSNISALQNKVRSDVTQIWQVRPEDMFTQMNTISTAIQSINTTLGRLDSTLLASLLSISQESLADIQYVRNKLADFRAITTVQRQILERTTPIINTWYTSGSIDLNIMISNPSDEKLKVPVKVYLPKEARMEHIIDNAGLDIQYDVQLDTLYATGEFQLGPRESMKKAIQMRDIWQIAEEDLNLMKAQSENLLKQLEKTQFSAQAVLLKNDLDTRINKIIRTQAENIASPQDKIMTYRENKESLAAVQKNLDELKNLVTQSAATRGFLGAFGGVQTIAVWGIIIAFVTGFSLLIIVLFSMWKHQMHLAGGQLALQARILSGGKVETETLAKIFADGVVTPKEENVLKKYLTKAEIERIEKRLAKKKIKETHKKTYISFLGYIKENLGKLLARFGKKILVAIITLGLTIGIIYTVSGLIGYLKSSESVSFGNLQSQTSAPAGTPPTQLTENLQNNLESSILPLAATSSPNAPTEKSATPSVEKPIFVIIKKTPTGWLNVRQEPSKNSVIIDRVDSGEKLEAIGLEEAKAGEKFGWYRIVLPDGKTGWVYGEYVQIVVSE